MNSADTYILFQLDEAFYGVPSSEVLHIDMLDHITPVPNTAAAVDGVVFSRGHVVPALNLRVRFGLPRRAPTTSTRLIFLRVQERAVAFVVDAAREFRSIPSSSLQSAEHTLVGIQGNYVRGVAKLGERHILLLDLPAVLNLDDLFALDAAATSVSSAATASPGPRESAIPRA